MPMETCRTCNKSFEGFQELALHIMSSKGHSKGKIWAAKFLSLKSWMKDKPERMEVTEEDRENKKDGRRVVSGNTQHVKTVCPNCKQSNVQSLPVEYIESRGAWKTSSGAFMVDCINCRKA